MPELRPSFVGVSTQVCPNFDPVLSESRPCHAMWWSAAARTWVECDDCLPEGFYPRTYQM